MNPWTPHRFDPVIYPGTPMVVTFTVAGGVIDSMDLVLDGKVFPFTVSPGVVEVTVPSASLDDVPDGATAEVRAVTGGLEYLVMRGYVTRSDQ